MRRLRTLITSLCCFVIVIVVLFSYNSHDYDEKELRQGLNMSGECNHHSLAKSWSTSLVTRYRPSIPANCDSLWAGDEQEVRRVRRLLGSWRNSVSDKLFLQQLHNCTYVREILCNNFYTSSVEKDFPIAFLLTIHDYPQQIIRLLRVLYRPHNLYCFHIDAKSKPELIEAIRTLSSCVPNILVPENLIEVFRAAGESVLESQLACLEMLHSAHDTWKWRYVMNLCGTELPLATNRQMIEHLQRLNGTTYILTENFTDESTLESRFWRKYKISSRKREPYESDEEFGKPPYGMQIHKSSTYVIMSYSFTHFVLTHPKAIAFRKYVEGSGNSEEQFYISLYHLPEAPIGDPPFDAHIILSTSVWMYSDASRARCNDTERHNVCIAGVATMKTVEYEFNRGSVFFFNKYSEQSDHVIMDCTEKKLVTRNKLEHAKDWTM